MQRAETGARIEGQNENADLGRVSANSPLDATDAQGKHSLVALPVPDDLDSIPTHAPGGTPFTGTVSAERSSVRSGPGAQHEAVAEVFRGQQVVIDEVASGWAHVRNGGWVPMQDLTR